MSCLIGIYKMLNVFQMHCTDRILFIILNLITYCVISLLQNQKLLLNFDTEQYDQENKAMP